MPLNKLDINPAESIRRLMMTTIARFEVAFSYSVELARLNLVFCG